MINGQPSSVRDIISECIGRSERVSRNTPFVHGHVRAAAVGVWLAVPSAKPVFQLESRFNRHQIELGWRRVPNRSRPELNAAVADPHVLRRDHLLRRTML